MQTEKENLVEIHSEIKGKHWCLTGLSMDVSICVTMTICTHFESYHTTSSSSTTHLSQPPIFQKTHSKKKIRYIF